MDRKIWTTPFGLALMIGSALALVAGYAYGTNAISVEANAYNSIVELDNVSGTLDENLLIDANREPVAEAPVRQPETKSAPPQAETREEETGPPDAAAPEPEEPDEPSVETVNEAGQ